MGSDSWWSGEDFSSGFSRQMTSKKEAVPAGVEEVPTKKTVSTLAYRLLEVANVVPDFLSMKYLFGSFSAKCLHLLSLEF